MSGHALLIVLFAAVLHASALVHDACGQPVEMKYFCPRCESRVRGGAVRLARGRAEQPAS